MVIHPSPATDRQGTQYNNKLPSLRVIPILTTPPHSFVVYIHINLYLLKGFGEHNIQS